MTEERSHPWGASDTRGARSFALSPYPYDRLADLERVASLHPGGAVDLSVGTPCDPPPAEVVVALSASGAEAGYPASIGSLQLRQAAVAWLSRRFGIELSASEIAACVGTKEFVASTAWYMRLVSPERDTVLCPSLAYPTYAMGASLAGCRAVGVPASPDGGLDLEAVPAEEAASALLLWVNSPANPSGRTSDLKAVAEWGRRHRVPVFSDECYAEFTWNGQPRTILEHGVEGVVAVHSLSKRSNLAGLRVGFYAGDPEIVSFLREVRKHAGLMVPGPVQHAATHALLDDAHVALQRARYQKRMERLREAFLAADMPCGLPEGGFYLWVEVPDWLVSTEGSPRASDAAPKGAVVHPPSRAWVLTCALAKAAGILVSPGDFYGADGMGHIRVAAVQPDDRIELACERLAKLGAGGLRRALEEG